MADTDHTATEMVTGDWNWETVDDPGPMVKNVEMNRNKLSTVMDLIRPFLTKLQQDPDKVMLRWPNRAKEAKAFLEKLDNIYKS